MKLKQIQLQGFKSFVDRTVLNFTDNVTCIVGPNGCGKSNIVDAIRWSLGEQSAKHLRGGTMEDVIFHGTEEVPPVGMAEVNLVFDNSRASCPPEYANFSEIQVTRRLFRSGESEYYINRAPCRLKDIVDLFLGSGMGTKAYSIIEQGRIEEIITMKHEQRRTLIEEAAGVSKYRVRRQEAVRKMEATRGNLLRIRDIIAELKRQMNSLNRQAKKAERYKKYRAELKELELQLVAFKARGIIRDKQEVQKRLKEQEEKEMETASRLKTAEATLERDRAELIELEKQLTTNRAAMMEAARASEKQENQISLIDREKDSEQQNLERIRGEIEELIEREKALAEEIADCRAEDERLGQAGAEAELSLTKAEQDKNAKVAEYRELAEATDVLEKHLLNVKAEIEKLGEKIEWTKKRREEQETRKQSVIQRKENAESKLEQQARTNLNFNEKLYQVRKDFAALAEQVSQHEQVIDRIKTERAVAADRLQQLQANQTRTQSRLASLQEMKKNFEGYQRGVKAIMKRKAQLEAQGKNGTYGLIADAVSIDPEYETALEAVLGERLQSIVVRTRKHGIENINFLREAGEGRSCFVPLEGLSAGEVAVPEPLRQMGAVPLAQKVSVQGEPAPAVRAMIGNALVVSDIERACEIREQIGADNTLVTRDGVLMDKLGVIAGGSQDSFSGVLQKNREMEELAAAIESLETQITDASSELAEIDRKTGELIERGEQLKEKLHRMEIEKNMIEKDLRQGTDRYNSIKDEIKALEEELTNIDDSNQWLAREADEAGQAITKDREDLVRVEDDLQKRRNSLEKLRAEREAHLQRCTAAQVQVAAVKEKLEAQKKHLQRLIASREEVREGVKKREEQLEKIGAKIRELSNRKDELSGIHQQAASALKELELKVEAEQTGYEQSAGEVREKENSLKQIFREKDNVKNERMDTELGLHQLKVDYEGLCENVRDRFSKELDEIVDQYPEPADAEFPVDQIREQRDQLREKLERIGDVNLTAIEEFDQISERHSFLSNQEADLIAALENLELTIAKINAAYKRSFKSTFDEVNQKFQEAFPRLFKGGKAFLQLTNPDDVLESGVEIYAQPPGKRMSTIGLLSGGEKALTSSAMIIALFMVKPSPFCLFDEVDAMLDDVNVARFNEILMELSDSSQMILVTHNKSTMELANTLYGVTMQNKGASKIVSVRLQEQGPDAVAANS